MKNNKNNKIKEPVDRFIKYSTIAIEMGVIIGGMSWGGVMLDDYLETKPVFTVILSLTGVLGSIFRVIKQLDKL